MISSLMALFKALPEFLTLMNRLSDVVLRVLNWAQENKEWIENLERAARELESANTPDQKLVAARALADSIHRL
jgi:hypothetical protein